jgi:hypothetical protein
MDQFDPDIPGLIEGDITGITITDPQPYPFGVGNRVLNENLPFTLTVTWEVFGVLTPVWVTALDDPWTVSVYAESMAAGPEILLGKAEVLKSAFTPIVNDPAKPNGRAYKADIVVPAGTLQEGDPGSEVSGIYKLVTSVFLNSSFPDEPGFDMVGFSEGPFIQVEDPH